MSLLGCQVYGLGTGGSCELTAVPSVWFVPLHSVHSHVCISDRVLSAGRSLPRLCVFLLLTAWKLQLIIVVPVSEIVSKVTCSYQTREQRIIHVYETQRVRHASGAIGGHVEMRWPCPSLY